MGFYTQDYPESIKKWGFSINALECFNTLLAIRLWVREWSGVTVLIFVDNWATVCALNSGRVQDPLMRGCLREAWWLTAMLDINLVVRHKPGTEMETADTLSRAGLSEAYEKKFAKFVAETSEVQKYLPWEMLQPPLQI